MTEEDRRPSGVAEALAAWRDAERVAAVARRGRLAASLAVEAAQKAATGATATADHARLALESALKADQTATETADAARLMLEAARGDLGAADTESGQTTIDEDQARLRYDQAVADAERRQGPRT